MPANGSVTEEPIHEWFELSYASYLVLPRSILQSLPVDLQSDLVSVLEDIDRHFGGEPVPHTGEYEVNLRDETGVYLDDPYRNYERGRRRIDPSEVAWWAGRERRRREREQG